MRTTLEGRASREDIERKYLRERSKRRCEFPVTITKTHFTDDIALISEQIKIAQRMLSAEKN